MKSLLSRIPTLISVALPAPHHGIFRIKIYQKKKIKSVLWLSGKVERKEEKLQQLRICFGQTLQVWVTLGNVQFIISVPAVVCLETWEGIWMSCTWGAGGFWEGHWLDWGAPEIQPSLPGAADHTLQDWICTGDGSRRGTGEWGIAREIRKGGG